MRKLLAILLLGFSCAQAQTVQTTPNLITSGTTHTWTGVTTGALPTGCGSNGSGGCAGGPTPLYDPATNTVHFSYNANAYVGQTIAINNALANVGAGVKINGYNYAYEVRNLNGDNRQTSTDTFTVATALRGPANSVLLSHNQYFNTKFDWTAYNGTKTATTPYDLNQVSYLQIGVTGGDNGYWGGYFGPQIRNVNMSLNYTVDPCATNPAYSPTCANYNTVNVSNNLVPNPGGYAVYGNSIDQSYAINQALQQSGAGVMIHGFQWGYVANANGPYCGSWDLGWFGCLDPRNPSVSTNVNITDVNGSSLYSIGRTYSNSYNTTNYQYLFPSSRNLATLGRFNFTASTNDAAYVGDMWSKAVYTPDPCTVNPLSSTSCPLYQQAFLEQQCAGNPLYSTQCSGYAQAYFNQQCSANQLYNPSCPGYASAYLTYQCSINPLYSTTCPGYETAYFNQQCSENSLYNSRCPGYEQAYHAQQCSINPLYATTCSGYASAYFDQQCRLNGLYSRDCPNYSEAYAKKSVLEKQGLASTIATAGVIAAQAPEPVTTTSTNNDGSSSVAVAVVADPIVNQAVTSTATSASPAAAATATVSLAPVAAPPPAPAVENKPAAQDKKPEGGQTTAPQQAQGGGGDKPQPSARQALAERRAEAAKKDAVEKGKNLANEMGKAADLEAQKQVQNVVIAAMGFTPGFDAYGKSIVPDVIGYRPFTVYNNQKTVDNARTLRQLSGASDRLHNEIVDSQYNRGN